jgi:ATPase complex subunit ATP10
MRKNTPAKEHDTTLLYFGSDVDDFRDVLRMHNIMTNYVFLVDSLGRIRFASSGEASSLEIERVTRFTKELSSLDLKQHGKKRSSKQRKQ